MENKTGKIMDIDLLMERLKQQIVNAIGSSGVPIYLVKYILKDLKDECDTISNQQLNEKILKLQQEKNAEKEEDKVEQE